MVGAGEIINEYEWVPECKWFPFKGFIPAFYYQGFPPQPGHEIRTVASITVKQWDWEARWFREAEGAKHMLCHRGEDTEGNLETPTPWIWTMWPGCFTLTCVKIKDMWAVVYTFYDTLTFEVMHLSENLPPLPSPWPLETWFYYHFMNEPLCSYFRFYLCQFSEGLSGTRIIEIRSYDHTFTEIRWTDTL